MKRFSAHYILTNSSDPIAKGIITTNDDGTIIDVEESGGALNETAAVEFHNGIIIPGFVNCHCHLELSHLRNKLSKGKGLGTFIMNIRDHRGAGSDLIGKAAKEADSELYNEGVVLCADICNTPLTFTLKQDSSIRYHNLLEVFGIDPAAAEKRIAEVKALESEALKKGLTCSVVPHSPYSVSLTLFRLIRTNFPEPAVSSIHFQETESEASFLEEQSGPLRTSYEAAGLFPERPELARSHSDVILNELPANGNLILVHNTSTDQDTIRKILKRGNLFWCLCPSSNLYIENRIPPVGLLQDEGCELVIGTDSLASNTSLSILKELKIIQQHFPGAKLEDLVRWSSYNGAKALNELNTFGRIVAGTRPGLLLIENADLHNLRLLPETTIRRLI